MSLPTRSLSLWALLLVAALLSAGMAHAIDNIPPLPDPALQQRYLSLTHELRCMQCQNESLADSPVGLASDLRREVRDMLQQGATDEQIRDHMVARYGEFILFRPRMSARNAWLWSAPFVLMIVAGVVAARVLRYRQRRVAIDDPGDTLSEESAGSGDAPIKT